MPTFARRRLNPHFELTQGPIVVGGVGGSGTRAVVEIMRRLGVYTGSELSPAGDNNWFTLLCKLPRWDLDDPAPVLRSLDLLERSMQGVLAPTRDDKRIISEAVKRSAAWSRRSYLADDAAEDWLRKVATSLLRSRHTVPFEAPRWGWKEPNSHLFLSHLRTHFADRLHYVHVIRNGVYMAHSANQAQVSRWGSLFGVETTHPVSSTASLDFWIRSNEEAISRGHAMPEGSFFLMNHDELCATPRNVVIRFVEFLGIETSQSVLEELISLPNSLKPLGISPQEMRREFGEERLSRVRRLGFALEG